MEFDSRQDTSSGTTKDNLVSGYNRFGFELFRQILRQDPDKNVLVSAASVAVALAMTHSGAADTTREAMAKVLGVEDISSEELNQANACLQQALECVDADVQLNIANSLWARKGTAFLPEFIQANKDFYKAEVTVLDFHDQEAAAIINAWVSRKTQEKIQKIIDRINPQDILYLINALYFKGKWSDAFDKTATVNRPFTLINGEQKQHPLMSRTGRYRYFQGEGFQAVILPYGSKNVSMYVFLPDKESSLEEFLCKLDLEAWEDWMTQFDDAIGLVMFPRFKLEYGKALNQTLMNLGMEVAFDPENANFSRMCQIPPNVFIGEVKHKTFVDVNEEGTEAAAVTSVSMKVTSARPPDKEFQMIVDRPFFFVIRDNRTGLVLFMGMVVEPE